jgi:hypothetical protein
LHLNRQEKLSSVMHVVEKIADCHAVIGDVGVFSTELGLRLSVSVSLSTDSFVLSLDRGFAFGHSWNPLRRCSMSGGGFFPDQLCGEFAFVFLENSDLRRRMKNASESVFVIQE